MTIQEKAKLITEYKNKNALHISPKELRGGATLVYNYDSLELYENIKQNTEEYTKRIISNFISKAEKGKSESSIVLYLIFDGDFDELPDKLSPFSDFVESSKDKIIAIHQYVKSIEEKEFFVGFPQVQTIYNYGYLYLSFGQILEAFKENNINYEFKTPVNSSYSFDARATEIVLTYRN